MAGNDAGGAVRPVDAITGPGGGANYTLVIPEPQGGAERRVDVGKLIAWLEVRRDVMSLAVLKAIYEGLIRRVEGGQFDVD